MKIEHIGRPENESLHYTVNIKYCTVHVFSTCIFGNDESNTMT
jgi:hypothetical protein